MPFNKACKNHKMALNGTYHTYLQMYQRNQNILFPQFNFISYELRFYYYRSRVDDIQRINTKFKSSNYAYTVLQPTFASFEDLRPNGREMGENEPQPN